MARYHFETMLDIGAAPQRVWDEVAAPTAWPSWWRWLQRVDVLSDGAADWVGRRHRFTFGTALPYTLSFDTRFVRVDPPTLIEVTAEGELEGRGQLLLAERAGGGTSVVYSWLVGTTRPWMNVVAPIARPLFSWNHDVLMRDFAAGLAQACDGPLLAIANRALAPSQPEFFTLPDARPRIGPGY